MQFLFGVDAYRACYMFSMDYGGELRKQVRTDERKEIKVYRLFKHPVLYCPTLGFVSHLPS